MVVQGGLDLGNDRMIFFDGLFKIICQPISPRFNGVIDDFYYGQFRFAGDDIGKSFGCCDMDAGIDEYKIIS